MHKKVSLIITKFLYYGYIDYPYDRLRQHRLKKDRLSMYSCHIEYDYMGKGECIDLLTLNDTYYIYPKTKSWSATKLSLVTEELYNLFSRT